MVSGMAIHCVPDKYMAHASTKITDFPRDIEGSTPVEPIRPGLLTEDRDPTREIRNLIERLQETAREARRRQRAAELECESLRLKLEEIDDRAKSPPVSEAKIKALIKERDMLLEQQSQYGPLISELKQKVRSFEAERAEAIRAREDADRERKLALQQAESAQRAAEEARAKKEDAIRQREAALRQRDLAREEKEDAFTKVAEAKKNFTAAQQALAEAKRELSSPKTNDATMEKQIASLRQARDGMAAQINELQHKVGELEDHAAELAYSLEGTEKEASQARARQVELEEALRATEAAGTGPAGSAAVSANDEQLQAELEDLRGKLEAVANERDATSQALEETHNSFIAAKMQVDAIIRDRDTLKEQFSNSAIAMDLELNAQIAEVKRLRLELGTTGASLSKNEQMAARFEERRLQMIDLNTQLENAQREIRLLSASLAESRLQAKLAAKKVVADAAQEKLQPRISAMPSNEPHGKSTVAAMRRCFQTLSHDHRQLSVLKEMESHAAQLANTARDTGLPLLHRVTVAFATLLGDIYETPEQLTQGTLSLFNQAVEFIGALLDNPETEQKVNLAATKVYVVDDDQNTCDLVVDALNMVGLQTEYALYSSTAVAELAGNHYDLIILDINLPDLDGFELCSHIRNMALHAETPVFFISGHASLENRVKSSLRGGNEFIAKPFNIQELALKSLKSVISSQLHASSR
jgi:CheY-like chemotaxis protein